LPPTRRTAPADPSRGREVAGGVPSGAPLVRRERESVNRSGSTLDFPEPLRRYESTEFVLCFRLPAGQRMRPHYVLAARRRCDIFDLRVRFDRAHPPRQVWEIREAFHRDLDDGTARGEPVIPDAACEVHLRFRNLRPALSYGGRWVDG